jgi:hypothetical protein
VKNGDENWNTKGEKEVIIERQKVAETAAFAAYIGHCFGRRLVSDRKRIGYVR